MAAADGCGIPGSRGKGDVSEFAATYIENYEKAGRDWLICIPSGNHDMHRLAYYLQGDEIGMRYVKQDESEYRPTVEAQMAEESSLLAEIRKMLAIRQAHVALQNRGEIACGNEEVRVPGCHAGFYRI